MDVIFTWIVQYGYLVLFGLLMFGIVGLPISDETLLTFAGYLISSNMNLRPFRQRWPPFLEASAVSRSVMASDGVSDRTSCITWGICSGCNHRILALCERGMVGGGNTLSRWDILYQARGIWPH